MALAQTEAFLAHQVSLRSTGSRARVTLCLGCGKGTRRSGLTGPRPHSLDTGKEEPSENSHWPGLSLCGRGVSELEG